MKKLVDCASVPVRLPEEQAREVDDIVKTLPSGLEFQKKSIEVEYMFEPGERAEVSILTKPDVDKSNEVVLPWGLDLDSYRKSMVVLWQHNPDRPVASCSWIKLHHDQVRAKTVYPDKPDDFNDPWFTDEIWSMTKCSPPILRCKSIGFLPLKPLRSPTPEELEKRPDWQGAGIYESTKLLEYSVVYTGCLDDALVQAVNTKSLNPVVLQAMGIPVPEAPAAPVAPVAPSLLARYKDAVSPRIKALQGKGWTEDQIIAMAYAEIHAKSVGKRKKKKKTFDVQEIISKIASGLDINGIVDAAVERYRNRGRV